MAFSATGGVKTIDGDYTVHKFTANGTLECTGTIEAEVFRVAGGASGSMGGAGAGGVLQSTEILSGTMPVTIGLGAAANAWANSGTYGTDTIFAGKTAKGGGPGGQGDALGFGGASGGGAGASGGSVLPGGAALYGAQGHEGGSNGSTASPYPCGGGGGAGGPGANGGATGGNGGPGITSDIVQRGTGVGYAGGGAGATYMDGTPGTATHGGGNGNDDGGNGAAGVDGTGGGGGGGGNLMHGGNGGSGVLVVRYPTVIGDTDITPVISSIAALQASLTPSINYCNNPSFENDSDGDGLADFWTNENYIVGVPVFGFVAGRVSGYAQNVQYTGIAGDSARWVHMKIDTAVGSFSAGEPATLSLYVKGTLTGGTECDLYLSAYNAAGTALSVDVNVGGITPTGSWERSSVSIASLPAGTALLRATVIISGIDAGESVDVSFDDCLIEKAATASDFWAGIKGGISANLVAVNGDLTSDASLTLHELRAPIVGDLHGTVDRVALVTSNSTIPYDGPWTRLGIVLAPSEAFDEDYVGEMSVIKDGATWKMWYKVGYNNPAQCYATSASPEGPWTKYAGNPVLEDVWLNNVLIVDGTYHLFGSFNGACNHYTSADGLAWTLSGSNLIRLGAGGWNSAVWCANKCVWVEDDGTWVMMFEARKAGDSFYTCGIATATDPDGPWTQYAGNPVLGDSRCNASRPYVLKSQGRYYCWFHGGYPGMMPVDILRASGDSPYNWTIDAWPLLKQASADEGINVEEGGIGDCFVVADDDTLYLFYDGGDSNNPPNNIFLATAPIVDAKLDAKLDAVKLKTDTLGSLAVTVTSPVAASGTITLSANDDYHTAHGRSIPFTIDDPTHALGLDDVDASVELRCSQATWTATAVETIGGYHVDFEIPHAGLTRSGHYQLKCLLADGDVVTKAKGEIVLDRDIPAVTAP